MSLPTTTTVGSSNGTVTVAPLDPTIVRQNLDRLRDLTVGELINRYEEVEAARRALIARQHMLLHGGPGIGKSLQNDRLTERIGGARVATVSFSKFTAPEDAFGALDPQGLKEGRIVHRVAGYLPGCDIGRLREVFNGGPSVLQSLQDILNERIFKNDGQVMPCDMATAYCDTNTIPTDDDLWPMYDRILVRRHVEGIGDSSSFRQLLGLRLPPVTPVVTWAEVRAAQEWAAALPLSSAAENAYIACWQAIRTLGIGITDRRWRDSVTVARATAWLEGADEVQPGHLECLTDICWEKVDQIKTVTTALLKIVSPNQEAVLKLSDQAGDYHEQWVKLPTDKTDKTVAEMHQIRAGVERTVKEAKKQAATASGRTLRTLMDTLRRLQTLNSRILMEGFDFPAEDAEMVCRKITEIGPK